MGLSANKLNFLSDIASNRFVFGAALTALAAGAAAGGIFIYRSLLKGRKDGAGIEPTDEQLIEGSTQLEQPGLRIGPKSLNARKDEVDEASWESFPASDPPARW